MLSVSAFWWSGRFCCTGHQAWDSGRKWMPGCLGARGAVLFPQHTTGPGSWDSLLLPSGTSTSSGWRSAGAGFPPTWPGKLKGKQVAGWISDWVGRQLTQLRCLGMLACQAGRGKWWVRGPPCSHPGLGRCCPSAGGYVWPHCSILPSPAATRGLHTGCHQF